MRILLTFGPEWRYCRQPYLALPYLAGYLKRQEHEVRCFDLNIGFIEYLAESGIRHIHRLVADAVMNAGGLYSVTRELSVKKDTRLSDMAWVANTSVEWLESRLRWAIKLLRDPARMPDLQGHRSATITLDKIWNAIHALVSPSQQGSAAMAPDYQQSSWQKVLDAAQSESNPYRQFLDEQADFMVDWKPDVVGISVAAAVQLTSAVTLALALQRQKIGPLIMGGNLVSRLLPNQKALDSLLGVFDILVYGEGEIVLSEITKRLHAGRSITGTPGTISLIAGKVLVKPPSRPVELSLLPVPDFSDLPLHSYLTAKPHLPVLAGRGCYWRRCKFCAHHIGYQGHRIRTAEAVTEDLTILASRHNVSVFTFEDDDLSPRMLWAMATVLHDKHFRWGCYARLEQTFNKDLCQNLVAAGCRYLFFGLESGCQRTLDRMNKGIDLSFVPSVLETCQQAGILVHLSLQFGYPGETKAEAEKTLQFLEAYHHLIDSVSCQPFRLEGLSLLARDPEQNGIKLISVPDDELAIYRSFESQEGNLSFQEIAELTERVAHFVASQHDSFILNRVPAYYGYFYTKKELTRLYKKAQEAEQRATTVLALGLEPAFPSPDVVTCVFGGTYLSFDWSTGVISSPDAETALALLSGTPRKWRVPTTDLQLFRPASTSVTEMAIVPRDNDSV